MLVTPRGDRRIVITQADHARLAASFLALFRLPDLLANPRRPELLRAVAEHDNGWWESDSAPEVDPATGAPRDFRALDREARWAVWRRGVERFAGEAPYLAALVATHALRLHRDRAGDPAWWEFTAELAARRDELLELAGRSPVELAEDDTWLEVADGLSLAACLAEPSFAGGSGRQARCTPRAEGNELAIAPFPLAGATWFSVACRELPAAPAATPGELARRLATATWVELRIRLAPLA